MTSWRASATGSMSALVHPVWRDHHRGFAGRPAFDPCAARSGARSRLRREAQRGPQTRAWRRWPSSDVPHPAQTRPAGAGRLGWCSSHHARGRPVPSIGGNSTPQRRQRRGPMRARSTPRHRPGAGRSPRRWPIAPRHQRSGSCDRVSPNRRNPGNLGRARNTPRGPRAPMSYGCGYPALVYALDQRARSRSGSWSEGLLLSVVPAGPGPRPAGRRQVRFGHRRPGSPGAEEAAVRFVGGLDRRREAGLVAGGQAGADDERGQALAPAVRLRADGREVPVGPGGPVAPPSPR